MVQLGLNLDLASGQGSIPPTFKSKHNHSDAKAHMKHFHAHDFDRLSLCLLKALHDMSI